jgi:Tol biopolymer transport system component
MGEVHKATDTRLNRTVAIKVLPQRFSEDLEMRQRFEREAKTIATLNHPHICTLYDVGNQDGVEFLVMEHLEGETLAARLTRGPLPLDEALTIAIAIADALDKAHSQGVTHRDLKPGNVMLTASGAKLLDFGLAKRSGPVASAGSSPDGATIGDSTVPGTILGTMPYMAPEQLEGRDSGPRTDIFAFGSVLYEMVTGKRAFDGRSQALLIAAIVSADPEPISKVQPGVPPALEYVVGRCLAKDPEQRMQTAWDLLAQLRWIAEGGAASGAIQSTASQRRREMMMIAAVVLILVVAALLTRPALRYVRGSDAPERIRFLVNLAETPVPEAVSVSPDGRTIGYASRDGGSSAVFLRSIDSLTAKKIAGTEGASRLFWAPDSSALAFFAGGQLKRLDVGNLTVHNICETADLLGGSWNRENVILFGSSKGLQRVPAAGGQPTPIASGDSKEKDGRREPFFLPDGEHYLYTSGTDKDAAIYAGVLDSADAERLVDANSNGVYVEPGYLLYHRDGTLYAQPFKASRRSLGGEPIRIADKIPFGTSGAGAFAASSTGILIFRNTPPPPPSTGITTGTTNIMPEPLVWVDRSGNTSRRLAEQASWFGVDLSPDGKRAAVHRHDPDGGDIWIFEPGLANPVKFTFEASQDSSSPIWSYDSRIAFAARRNGKWGIYTKLADNTGGEKLLLESEVPLIPMSWSRDSKVLLYTMLNPRTGSDIWKLNLSGDKPETVPFLQTIADERNPQLSPDGKWIAYSSNTSGRSEIYIKPFPEGAGIIQVSVNGGVYPRWRADGKALYFLSLVSVGAMMTVDLDIRGAEIRKHADPDVLFQSGFFESTHAGGPSHAYAVSADGQQFLLPQLENILNGGIRTENVATLVARATTFIAADRRGPASSTGSSTMPITVVPDWTATLKK